MNTRSNTGVGIRSTKQRTAVIKALEHFEQLRDAKAVQAWLRRLFEATLIDLGTRCQRDVASGRPNAAEL